MKTIVITCGNKVHAIFNAEFPDNTDAIAARVLRNLVREYFPELSSRELNLIEKNKKCIRTDNQDRVWTFSICDSRPVQSHVDLLVSPPKFKESDYYSSDWDMGVILCNRAYAIDKIIGRNDVLYNRDDIDEEIKKLKKYNIFNEDGESLDADNNFRNIQARYEKMLSLV